VFVNRPVRPLDFVIITSMLARNMAHSLSTCLDDMCHLLVGHYKFEEELNSSIAMLHRDLETLQED
jgi:hypothetical protein